MSGIQKYQTLLCRVKIRKGKVWIVRPGCEQLDGLEVKLIASWLLTASDHAFYKGEWALCPADLESSKILGLGGIAWIASGDVEVISKI